MATTFSEDYKLSFREQDVTLSIKIGFAQIAQTVIRVGGKVLKVTAKDEHGNDLLPSSKGSYKNTFSVVVGTTATLKDKTILIVSVVERVQNDDNTSVEISMSGGEAQRTFPLLTAKAAAKGDTVIYDPDITCKP